MHIVPSLKGLTASFAKRLLKAANCALGKVTKKKTTKRRQVGKVMSQKTRAGTALAEGKIKKKNWAKSNRSCGQRGLQSRFLGDQPDVGTAAAAHEDIVAVCGPLEVVAEMVAKFVGAHVERLGR